MKNPANGLCSYFEIMAVKKNYFVGFSLLYRASGSVTCHGTLMQTEKIIGDQCSVKKLRKFIDEYYFVALKILIKLILCLPGEPDSPWGPARPEI